MFIKQKSVAFFELRIITNFTVVKHPSLIKEILRKGSKCILMLYYFLFSTTIILNIRFIVTEVQYSSVTKEKAILDYFCL